MKDNNGWQACIILGILIFIPGLILCISHPESIGFPIFILIVGLVLFIVGIVQREKIQEAEEIKKDIEEGRIKLSPRPNMFIDYKTLDQQMIFRYKFENEQVITAICDIITNVTLKYNKQNQANISSVRVANLLFHRFNEDFRTLTLDEVRNTHFGFIGYALICCIIVSDKTYKEMKDQICLDTEFEIDGYSSNDLKTDFLSIMDDCYIDLSMNNILELDNIEDETLLAEKWEKSINGQELFDETLKRFAKKYNLFNLDFIKEKDIPE